MLLLLSKPSAILLSSSSCSTPAKLLLLLVLDHDLKPLLEVFLHAHSAAFQQTLNPLNLALQVLQLSILTRILLLVLVDALLNLIFFISLEELTIIVNHTSESVLLANLLNLISQIFDRSASLVHASSELLAPSIFLFQQSSVLFHRFVLPIALTEHIKSFCPISQVL